MIRRTSQAVMTRPAPYAGIWARKNGPRPAPATTSIRISATHSTWRPSSIALIQPNRSSPCSDAASSICVDCSSSPTPTASVPDTSTES